MRYSPRRGGFTFLQLILMFCIGGGNAGFVGPRFRTGLYRYRNERFLHAMTAVFNECWRDAKRKWFGTSLTFDSLNSGVRWEGVEAFVSYPSGCRRLQLRSGLFQPDCPPSSPTIERYWAADAIMVPCVLTDQRDKRRQ
jgi:hypothetical protein